MGPYLARRSTGIISAVDFLPFLILEPGWSVLLSLDLQSPYQLLSVLIFLVRHLILNALEMRFGEPVNKDAPSIKTVARRRAPSRKTGAFTNQGLFIT
jgi:hypothetical protein